MKLKEGKISIFINMEFTEIEILDDNAAITFVKVKLTPEQLSSALGRLGRTDCQIEVISLDKVGKTHENKNFEFEIPKELYGTKNIKELELFCEGALYKSGMADWQSDAYYQSQNSFFNKDGKSFARVIIRRWV